MDNMLIAAKVMSNIDVLKHQLSLECETKDLGLTKKILGMKISLVRTVGVL